MIMRDRKRLQVRLKIKKIHVMVMLVCMNVVNTSATQRMNMRVQQRIYPSVRWKSLLQSKNRILKTFRIVLCF